MLCVFLEPSVVTTSLTQAKTNSAPTTVAITTTEFNNDTPSTTLQSEPQTNPLQTQGQKPAGIAILMQKEHHQW